MDWVTEPHQLDPVIGEAADRISGLLPSSAIAGVPLSAEHGNNWNGNGDRLVNARDCELAGFDLALALEAAKRYAQ